MLQRLFGLIGHDQHLGHELIEPQPLATRRCQSIERGPRARPIAQAQLHVSQQIEQDRVGRIRLQCGDQANAGRVVILLGNRLARGAKLLSISAVIIRLPRFRYD